MQKRTRIIAVGIALLVILVGVVVAKGYFLPEKAQHVDEAMMESGDTSVLASGTFTGRTGHHVSGTVKLLRMGSDHFLRFENYDQTQGPDVFLYLTPSPTPDSGSEIGAGRKILVDGGADGGEITKEGNWNQKLPADLDLPSFQGVGMWCDNFRVPFGYATLAWA